MIYFFGGWCEYMHRRIYISSDYSESSGDRNVVAQFFSWRDNKHLLIDFVDMAQVISGSIADTQQFTTF